MSIGVKGTISVPLTLRMLHFTCCPSRLLWNSWPTLAPGSLQTRLQAQDASPPVLTHVWDFCKLIALSPYPQPNVRGMRVLAL